MKTVIIGSLVVFTLAGNLLYHQIADGPSFWGSVGCLVLVAIGLDLVLRTKKQ